jgi:adenosylhomocysteinase
MRSRFLKRFSGNSASPPRQALFYPPADIRSPPRQGLLLLPLTKTLLRERKTESLELLGHHVGKDRFIVLDIGGYFAAIASAMKARFGSRMIGIVEDTENGYQKYMAAFPRVPDFPLVSSARSPLKKPEDSLIGLSIVFSTEAKLCTRNMILLNKTALVLGYGKIGCSIAESLRRRDVDVYVSENHRCPTASRSSRTSTACCRTSTSRFRPPATGPSGSRSSI